MIVGFIDTTGRRVPFAELEGGEWAYPLPVIRWLAKQHDDHGARYGFDGLGFSVTELVAPTQVTMLKRRHEVYVQPDEGIKSALGTLMHHAIEMGTPDNDTCIRREHKMVKEIDGVQIGGTADLIDMTTGATVGSDYKLTARYSVKKILDQGVRDGSPDYFWQANVYSWLLDGADHWALVCVTRDHDSRTKHKPIETIQVPLLPLEEVEAYIKHRVAELTAYQDVWDGGLPLCTDEETWQGRRCAGYCEGAAFCFQYRPELAEGRDG